MAKFNKKKGKKNPAVGDVVLVEKGIGIVRYKGEVDFDPDEMYLGIEIKGPPVTGGTNGKQNGKQYFKCLPKRGIFVKKAIRTVTNEEILDKCAHLYDIVQGRTGFSKQQNKHFIDRKTYDNLLDNYNILKAQYASLDKSLNEYDKMILEYAILKEKIGLIKDDYSTKIHENAKLNDKIIRAEKKLGTRLSKMDMSTIMSKLTSEFGINNISNNDMNNNNNNIYSVPDYGKIYGTSDNDNNNNNNNKPTHTKNKSSMTMALENENMDFHKIAQDVADTTGVNYTQSTEVQGKRKRGSVDHNNENIIDKMEDDKYQKSATHFRKFSNTTKIVMKQNESKKKDTYNSNENKPKGVEKGSLRKAGKKRRSLNMNDNDFGGINNENKPKHKARGSVDIDSMDIQKRSRKARDSGTIDNFAPEYDDNNDDDDDEEETTNDVYNKTNVDDDMDIDNNDSDNNNNNNKTHVKARGSIGLDDNDVNNINKENNINVRASRESKIMDNISNEILDQNIDNNDGDNIILEDDPFGDKLASKMGSKKSKHKNQISTTLENIEKPAILLKEDDDDEF